MLCPLSLLYVGFLDASILCRSCTRCHNCWDFIHTSAFLCLKNTASFKLFITSVLTPPMPSSSKNPEPLGEDYDTQVSLSAEHSTIFYSLYADSLMVSVLTVIYFEKKLLWSIFPGWNPPESLFLMPRWHSDIWRLSSSNFYWTLEVEWEKKRGEETNRKPKIEQLIVLRMVVGFCFQTMQGGD